MVQYRQRQYVLHRFILRIVEVVIAVAAMLLMAGCMQNKDRETQVPGPTATGNPLADDLAVLQFESQQIEARMKMLDQCIRELAGKDWTFLPYRQTGNFYSASWCSGAGARSDCVIAQGSIDRRDQHVIELSTLFYPDSFPHVFGLEFQTLWTPPAAGWGSSFYYSEGGKSILGDSLSLAFMEYGQPSGEPKEKVYLGSSLRYTVEHTDIDVASNIPLAEQVTLYSKSAESLRDQGMQMLDMLSAKVEQTIQTHQAEKCEYGPYQGGGIPPVCNPRPLTTGEEAASLATEQSYFATQKQLVRDHYQDMYAALLKAFPFDRCWK